MSAQRSGRGLLVAAGAALILAIAGCGGGGNDTGTSSGTSGADTTASTTEGGTLRWAINAPGSWDPVTSPAGSDIRQLGLVYEGLTKPDEKGTATPGLATSWKYSTDGKELTFTLRSGVTFSDGSAFDANVVKQNLERAQTQKDSVVTQLLANVKSIEVVDPHTVTLKLSKLDYGLPLVLGGKAGLQVSPKELDGDVAKIGRQPVGAGPFILKKFVPDASATLVRNPNYWDAKDIHLDGVDLQFLNDPQAVLAALQSGSLDLASSTGNQVKPAQSAGLEASVFPSLSANSIEINAAMKPFTDPRVAQAVNYAIDREALIRTQNGGIGEPAYQVFPKGYVGYSPDVANLYPHDPDKAKELLKEAGYDGSPITITYFDLLNFKSLAEQLQAQLATVGIKSKLATITPAEAGQRVYVDHDVAFNPNGIAGRESPLQMLDVQYGADGLLNPCRCASAELTKAIDAAGALPLDSPDYPAALQKVTALGARESAVALLYTTPVVLLHTKKVTGLRPYIVATRLEGVRLAK